MGAFAGRLTPKSSSVSGSGRGEEPGPGDSELLPRPYSNGSTYGEESGGGDSAEETRGVESTGVDDTTEVS